MQGGEPLRLLHVRVDADLEQQQRRSPVWPPAAAALSAVPVIQPCPRTSGSAPRASRSRTASVWPKNAARCSGVNPSPLVAFPDRVRPQQLAEPVEIAEGRGLEDIELGHVGTHGRHEPAIHLVASAHQGGDPSSSRSVASHGWSSRPANRADVGRRDQAKRSSSVLAMASILPLRLYLLRLSK